MPDHDDQDSTARLRKLISRSDANGFFETVDLEEIARLLGQNDPWESPPPRQTMVPHMVRSPALSAGFGRVETPSHRRQDGGETGRPRQADRASR